MRRRGCVARIVRRSLLLCALLCMPQAAPALELLNGRVQVHGFFESQLRGISEDFNSEWDLSQWYQILNLELEFDLVREAIGPLDLVSGFMRVEGRFDCVYSHGCGMLRTGSVYGDHPRKLPLRHRNARGRVFAGAIGIELDTGRFGESGAAVPLDRVDGFATLFDQTDADGFDGNPSLSTACLNELGAGLCGLLAGGSANSRVANVDDPAPYVFEHVLPFRFTQIQGRGGAVSGNPVRRLGPWRPRDEIFANAGLADRVNPFDASRQSPVLLAAVYNTALLDGADPDAAFGIARTATGAGARPFRPIPVEAEGRRNATDAVARGLYIPSAPLRRAIRDGRVDALPLNFSETQRAFNRGASQQDEGELKEAYLDIELFDSRLWLRLGKQSIVWGKTELFRTTDQFNPQDLALSSLPSLEESRIALWAARGIWSFYEVGPLEDVRLELAFNFDEYESADLGACGEPYTIDLICEAAFGVVAHNLTAIGIVGVDTPPSPWKSLKGWEIGGRLEFRYDRFSFAISDFYGYPDLPFPERITTYERNVDPSTGWPRILGARGVCTDGSQPACLRPGPTVSRTLSSDPTRPNDPLLQIPNPAFDAEQQARLDDPNGALNAHPANQQIFAMICSTTIGIVALDRTACGQTAFGSQSAPSPSFFSISQIVSAALAGSPRANAALGSQFGLQLPLARLSVDANDLSNGGTDCTDDIWRLGPNNPAPGSGPAPPCGSGGAGLFAAVGAALGQRLTPEQEALLGCGPLWGTNCDDSGLDLLNTEASVLLQSFTGFDGTVKGWRTDDASRPQPGTVGFDGGPVCPSQYLGVRVQNPKLPGCRGPGDLDYRVEVDGDPLRVESILTQALCPLCVTPGTLGHPFTGQTWQNELAALSWNFQLLTIFQDTAFDPDDPFNADGDQCSFVTPQFCPNIQGLLRLSGMQRNVTRAGGNARFGRRDFQWHSGGELLLRFNKRNVLGFAFDFAEDRSKTNVNLEFTWIEGVSGFDNDAFDGETEVDEFNLTISVDRPTFINFLNPNRTFFFNTQWFIQYRSGHTSGFATPAWNFLGTLAITTGYYQDRLLPSLVLVYDVHSRSGAALPEITYRYNEAFSVTAGAALFAGRAQLIDMPVNEVGPGNRAGPNAFKDQAENGLSVLRDRDELFLRLRYTF